MVGGKRRIVLAMIAERFDWQRCSSHHTRLLVGDVGLPCDPLNMQPAYDVWDREYEERHVFDEGGTLNVLQVASDLLRDPRNGLVIS